MKMQPITRAAIAAAALMMAAGGAHAAGGSSSCEDSFGTLKEIETQVGGSFAFRNIVNQYVRRWDAAKARQLCEAYTAGEPVTISCLDGQRDWAAIKATIPEDYFGQSNKALASTYEAERRKGNGFKEAMEYCRGVGAIQ
jgi:hypothetical protein